MLFDVYCQSFGVIQGVLGFKGLVRGWFRCYLGLVQSFLRVRSCFRFLSKVGVVIDLRLVCVDSGWFGLDWFI